MTRQLHTQGWQCLCIVEQKSNLVHTGSVHVCAVRGAQAVTCCGPVLICQSGAVSLPLCGMLCAHRWLAYCASGMLYVGTYTRLSDVLGSTRLHDVRVCSMRAMQLVARTSSSTAMSVLIKIMCMRKQSDYTHAQQDCRPDAPSHVSIYLAVYRLAQTHARLQAVQSTSLPSAALPCDEHTACSPLFDTNNTTIASATSVCPYSALEYVQPSSRSKPERSMGRRGQRQRQQRRLRLDGGAGGGAALEVEEVGLASAEVVVAVAVLLGLDLDVGDRLDSGGDLDR